jgi:hypothetical protein
MAFDAAVAVSDMDWEMLFWFSSDIKPNKPESNRQKSAHEVGLDRSKFWNNLGPKNKNCLEFHSGALGGIRCKN